MKTADQKSEKKEEQVAKEETRQPPFSFYFYMRKENYECQAYKIDPI